MIVKSLSIVIPGEPVGKGRPRFLRGSGRTYTPEKTAKYENLVALEFSNAFPLWKPTTEPIEMTMTAFLGIPKSWSKKKHQQALEGLLRPTKKPDTDNIAKIKDALNGIAFVDDAQVIKETVSKEYSDQPRLEITIEIWRPE